MLTRTDIIEAEINFPRDWATQVIDRPDGILYHTPEIPDSYDGNHAHITHAADPAVSVRKVAAFYAQHGITPRIYHLCDGGDRYGAALRAAVAAEGFTFFLEEPAIFFLREPSTPIVPATVPGLSIHRVRDCSSALARMIERSDGPRFRKVVQRRLASPTYHLLVAFLEDQPVAIASLQELPKLTRVDDVHTSREHRGRGLGSALIQHIVAYHARQFSTPLSLSASNPTAIRIYSAAGFTQIHPAFDFWSARKE
jgi:GNAT superfamily N-acetyltransferase